MKRSLSLIIAVLTVLLFSGCASSSLKNAENTQIYRENVVDFSLYIPETWILDSTSYVVSAHASKDDASTVIMTQASLPGGYHEIPAIFEASKDEMAKLYTFKTLEEAVTRKVANTDAAVYQYSLTDKSSQSILHYLQCMFIQGSTLYTFTYYATPELYQTHMKEVNQMLDAITFEKGKAPAGMIAAVSAGNRDIDYSDFTIQIPAEWTVETSTGIFTAMGGAGDASNLSVMRTTVEEETSAAQYYDDHKESLKEGLSSYELIELKKDVITKDTNGKSYSAVTVEYTATVSGQAYHFKQLFCANGTTMYLVTFSVPESLYPQHTDTINHSLTSFTLNVK